MTARWRFLGSIAAGLLLPLAACGLPQSVLNPQGTAADKLATLTWIEIIMLSAISFIMWALIAWAGTRRRGSLESHAPWDSRGGQRWVLIGGFAVPFVVLSTLFGLGIDWLAKFPVDQARSPAGPDIQIIGHQWWWELRYLKGPVDQHFTTANEIHIPVGCPVNIELETADVIHSFWVPTLHGKIDLVPGQPNYIRIVANHAGEFGGQCAEFCGEEHARMLLRVIAQPEAEYEAWRAQQLSNAAEPTSAEAIHGREVFMSAACVLCHQVRGTLAQGHVAPDLTHIGSRERIAANYYENNQANLEAWVTHAQSLKPGAEMPNLTAFSGSDLRALVAYLQQLK